MARAKAAAQRIDAWLGGLDTERPLGLVLTGPSAVAWACGGVAPPVDRSAATDLVWAVFTVHGAALITTNVEADRIAAEYRPAAHGFADLVTVPWQNPEAFVRSAERLAGAPAGLARPMATLRSDWMSARISSRCGWHYPKRISRTWPTSGKTRPRRCNLP